jgi:hypothetical protein
MGSLVEKIISDQLPEALHLEYKRSSVVIDKKIDDICKAVGAMANSDGGSVVFGIAEIKGTQKIELDTGLDEVARKIEWLDNVLASNISPRILGLSVSAEEYQGKDFIVVSVPKSTNAPHMSADKRYYKRSNNRSFPMEAYEVEDIRHRCIVGPAPITVEVEVCARGRALLVIQNRSDAVCRAFQISLRSNFGMSSFKECKHHEITLSRVGVGQRIEYMLGSTWGILSEATDAAVEVTGTYSCDYSNNVMQVNDRICIGELAMTVLPADELADGLKEIAKEIQKLKDENKKIVDVSEEISNVMQGAGIRLSPFSVFKLQRSKGGGAFEAFKYDVYGLTMQGMAEVLETTTDVISEFYYTFRYMGHNESIEDRLSKLPDVVARCARERLNFKSFK